MGSPKTRKEYYKEFEEEEFKTSGDRLLYITNSGRWVFNLNFSIIEFIYRLFAYGSSLVMLSAILYKSFGTSVFLDGIYSVISIIIMIYAFMPWFFDKRRPKDE